MSGALLSNEVTATRHPIGEMTADEVMATGRLLEKLEPEDVKGA